MGVLNAGGLLIVEVGAGQADAVVGILRAAGFELLDLADVPARVVISEYIDVAHAFFDGDEPKVINGVLDQLARKLRPGELPER